MKVIIDLCVVPLGAGLSVSKFVAGKLAPSRRFLESTRFLTLAQWVVRQVIRNSDKPGAADNIAHRYPCKVVQQAI